MVEGVIRRIISKIVAMLRLRRGCPHLDVDPRHHQIRQAGDLPIGQFPALGDVVPSLDAAPAAGRGGMLRGEDGMAAPRSLSAVLDGLRVPDT